MPVVTSAIAGTASAASTVKSSVFCVVRIVGVVVRTVVGWVGCRLLGYKRDEQRVMSVVGEMTGIGERRNELAPAHRRAFAGFELL
jgi:predicted Na+-dependent transporter